MWIRMWIFIFALTEFNILYKQYMCIIKTCALSIPGSVFVYLAYEPNYDFRLSADYCERTVYKFAFWITNAIYIAILMALLGLCCSQLYKLCNKRAQKNCVIRTVS